MDLSQTFQYACGVVRVMDGRNYASLKRSCKPRSSCTDDEWADLCTDLPNGNQRCNGCDYEISYHKCGPIEDDEEEDGKFV